MEVSNELKKILIYDVKLVTATKLENISTIIVFILEHDMIIVARTNVLRLQMPDVLFSAGQSKLKSVKEIRLNLDRFFILASDTSVEVSDYLFEPTENLDLRIQTLYGLEDGSVSFAYSGASIASN